MNRQKKQQPPSSRRQTGSKPKPVPNMINIPQQSPGVSPVGVGLNAVNNVLAPIPQKSTPSSREEEVSRTAILMYEHLEEQIGRADTKAQLMLAADALLAGALAALGKGAAGSLLSNASPILDRAADLFAILMFLALVCSFYWALRVVNPYLKGSKRVTLMFFGRIAQMDETDFINAFQNQSLADLRASTLAQVHTKSRIAQFKFARARRSVNFLIVALIFWAIVQILLAFA